MRLLDYFAHPGPNGTHICMCFDVMGPNVLALIKRPAAHSAVRRAVTTQDGSSSVRGVRIFPRSKIGRVFARAMRRAERIIAVSKGLRDELVGLDVVSDRIVIVPTGVDREKFFPVDRDEARAAIGIDARPLIAVPARLAPEKGITVLLDALAGLPEAQCVLIGEGRQRFELHAQCARLGIAERVHFAGFQPESRIRLYASAADLVCLPSFEEGWPDAIMEAFSCGCPVVASAVGGVPEQIALTNCGLTAPPGDVDGLRLALRAALDRTWDRAACAAAMAKHTLTRTGERYVEVCAEAASVYRRR